MHVPPHQVHSPASAVSHARKLGVPDDHLGAVAAAAVRTPPLVLWRRLLTLTAVALGTGLCASGVITFVAYNWAALGRLPRLGLMQLLLIATTLAATRLRALLGSQLALSFSAVLVGGLLAVFGQTYQTGADPFQLFVLWAVLIVPWTIAARFEPLTLLLSLIAGTGIVLAWQQLEADNETAFLAGLQSVWLLAVLATAAWEWRARRAAIETPRRWLPHTWAATGGAALAIAAGAQILDNDRDAVLVLVTAVAVMTTLGLTIWRYHLVRVDLFLQTVVIGVMITVVTCALGRTLLGIGAEFGGLMLLGLIVVAQVGAAAMWLRREGQRSQRA